MKKYLIILVCVLLCGCVSTKKIRNQSLGVAKFDIAKFNGNYANKADSAKGFYANEPLFGQLFRYLEEKASETSQFLENQRREIGCLFAII